MDPQRRPDAHLAAAEAALVAGDSIAADALAGQAAPHLTQPLLRGRARRVHARCLQAQGRNPEAVRMLVDAALEMGTADPGRARDTMLEAITAAQVDGWFGPEYAEVARAVRRLPPAPAELPGAGLLEGYAAIHEGRTEEGYALLRQGVRSMSAAYDARTTPCLGWWPGWRPLALSTTTQRGRTWSGTGFPRSATAGR